MRYECAACKRSFAEAGFCPYDGKPLAPVAGASDPTLQGETVRAVSGRDDESGAAKQALKDRVNEYDRLVGETLDGRYFVKKKIGEGGMGVVFEARHAVIERPLAIKVLKREATRDTATIQRFVQEAKASSRIGHPNIVEVTDFGTTPDGLTYSVMELVDGTTLAKLIKETAPMPVERAVRIVTQIARALDAAHAKGIVHRDLKPENVFLIDRDGRPDFVKIVDFGIAKVQPVEGVQRPDAPRLTRTGAVFGTPEYMAPEQAAGRSDTDRRVDVYALGTIFYQMLVGKVPHKGGSMVRTIAMQMLDPVTPPRQAREDLKISDALEAVIMKSLAKQRDDRYPSMSELIAALDAISGDLLSDPALSLPAVPPGADADTIGGPPRRSKPATKQLHEPEFVAGGPLSLAVLDEAPPEESAKRWPWALLAVVVILGGGIAAYVALRGAPDDDRIAEVPHDAAVAHADARIVAEIPVDAAVPPDAAASIVATTRDAGVHGHPELPGPHPATWRIEVLTDPPESSVFVGDTFQGRTGVHMERPWGTKLKIECKMPHYHGSKVIVFDDRTTSVMCAAKRLKMCVEGLKNPYDECEEPTPSGPVTAPTP